MVKKFHNIQSFILAGGQENKQSRFAKFTFPQDCSSSKMSDQNGDHHDTGDQSQPSSGAENNYQSGEEFELVVSDDPAFISHLSIREALDALTELRVFSVGVDLDLDSEDIH